MAIRYFEFDHRPAAVVDLHHEVLIPWSCWRRERFPETPFERVRALAVAAKDAGFSRISVVLPSAR